MALVEKLTDFRPALRRRVHEDIAEQLRDAILDGRLPAGSKLPSERELALEFQVNRTSIRDAMKVLEGLNLVHVRHGGGATVLPIVDASLDLLPAMIFRHGQIDLKIVKDLHEVVRPILYEMARLALERSTEAHGARFRELSALMADETLDQETRAAAARDLLVAIADMTGNRVWQMLARRVRALLSSEPLRETRLRFRKDFRKLSALVEECMKHRAARRADAALESLRRAIDFIGADFNSGKR